MLTVYGSPEKHHGDHLSILDALEHRDEQLAVERMQLLLARDAGVDAAHPRRNLLNKTQPFLRSNSRMNSTRALTPSSGNAL